MKIASFKEFLDMPAETDQETKNTLEALAEAHPVIRSNSVVQRILRNKNSRISLSEIAYINTSIFMQANQLARQMPSADEKQRFLILSEQILLNTAASTIASAIAAKLSTANNRAYKP